jgi:uncharacterized protein HemX
MAALIPAAREQSRAPKTAAMSQVPVPASSSNSSSRKLLRRVSLPVALLLAMACVAPAYAGRNDANNASNRAYRKQAKRAQKDMRRYAKQQRKAMKQSAKAQKKALKRARRNQAHY